MSKNAEITISTNAGEVARDLQGVLDQIRGLDQDPVEVVECRPIATPLLAGAMRAIDYLKLSGMTRGARKRAALWDVFVPWGFREYGYDPSKVNPKAERRHMRGCLGNQDLRMRYNARRLDYKLPGKLVRLEGAALAEAQARARALGSNFLQPGDNPSELEDFPCQAMMEIRQIG